MKFNRAEWAEIANTIELPKDARFQIGASLATFKSLRAADTTSLKTKRSVEKVRRHAAKLSAELSRLAVDPTFFDAGQPPWSSRPRPDRTEFDQLLSVLGKLDGIMATAQSRMRMSPGRKSKEQIDFLVQMLSVIQAKVSRDNVQRSNKKTEKSRGNRFVVLCAKKVGLTEPQVGRALKRTITTFHDMLINQGYDGSTGEYIDGAHLPKARRSRAAAILKAKKEKRRLPSSFS